MPRLMNTRIVIGNNLDPWRNLAMEEYLLEDVKPKECILYLWQNQNTVVIGKNQNAWKECRIRLLESEGGKLARRSSGGGAVFHDTGNLNFSFLVDKGFYDESRQLEVVLDAVNDMGIKAVFSGRNDLTVDGKKFSGNAFCFRKNSALHHGTILIAADMDKLTRYLEVPEDKIRSKGIESIRSRVVNLREYYPKLDVPSMIQALIRNFGRVYGQTQDISYGEEGFDQNLLNKLNEKYKSWEWRFGESPKFDIELNTRFPWGGIHLGLELKQGKISKAHIYSDAMDEALIEMIPDIIQGCLFNSPNIADSLAEVKVGAKRGEMLRDIADWIRSKGF
ncbi:MAG TPA: lipoate--protein ligase [Clostridia bacterium]|nr:lipoate--protein ligase [Clostridia bacterium]